MNENEKKSEIIYQIVLVIYMKRLLMVWVKNISECWWKLLHFLHFLHPVLPEYKMWLNDFVVLCLRSDSMWGFRVYHQWQPSMMSPGGDTGIKVLQCPMPRLIIPGLIRHHMKADFFLKSTSKCCSLPLLPHSAEPGERKQERQRGWGGIIWWEGIRGGGIGLCGWIWGTDRTN